MADAYLDIDQAAGYAPDVELHSGDLLVFGEASRLAYHGVPKLLPGIEVPDIGLPRGRLNITLRASGMTAGTT